MNFLEQIGTPATFILIILIVVISFILLRTSRYYSRQRQDEPDWSRSAQPRRKGDSTAAPTKPERHLDATPETTQWEVEMHETARELSARLDSKMSALQALIAEADRASARLEADLKNGDDAPSQPPRRGGTPLFKSQISPPPSNQAEALRSAPAATAAGVAPKHRREEIYTLSDHGLNDSAIAQRLGVPVGEVELILSLRGKK